jgi:murein DD-endopeptidase MepM/ murein hydrolase activator NlpD
METLLVRRRLLFLPGLLAVLFVSGSSVAQSAAPSSGASSRATAVRIVLPGQNAIVNAAVSSPPDAVSFGSGFLYPADGSIVTTGPVTASASASAGDASAQATASSEVASVVLFGGELTVTQVVARSRASGRNGQASGDVEGSAVNGLLVDGQAVAAAPGQRVPLGDWGYALVLAQGSAPGGDGYRGFVTALEVHLTADHGGLPAGSSIAFGYVETVAKAPAAAAPATPPPTRTGPLDPPAIDRPPPRGTGVPKPGSGASRAPVRPIPALTPQLTRGGYVFPVHGPASFTDTFGAARAVVGWHHGEDIFAPMGAPVLAVARGTVFSVGWNDVGGNRLWLRDQQGNEFYYAHLSAFSPLAVNGARVEAGDVLGFVGNSGDAETTPPHLHFEIHPVGLLGLGYDGVIAPHEYLLAWRRLEDVRFIAGAGWAAPVQRNSRAPRPGAFLLSASDISTASGLTPGSLRRALDPPAASSEAHTGGG